MDEHTGAKWMQIAIEIGHGVRSTVNTPAMIGTKDETGYILLFFNADHHDGKATLVTSGTAADVKKILKHTLRNLAHAVTIEPEKKQ